ncbi:MAG TPA: sugar ABC transporter substrate-binding protein [Actinomycetota bacterium]|nr:sugar ABC transporter substrate-binding protein [Actinomycetota bacterium]
MKARLLFATLLVAVLAAAGCSSSDDGGSQSGTGGSKTLTVWLMDGSAPDKLVADLNTEFQAAHSGVKVTYAKQQWNGIQDKLTTALASNNPPDVIELGNTQTAKFASSGALADLTGKVSDLGGQNWLKAMTESGAWQGKQYGVPFYAANRVVIYRTDLFSKAGVSAPTSLDQWISDGQKLAAANKSNGRFMPLYLPGQNWYFLSSLIWDQGGDLAVKNGDTWKGALDTQQAQAGIADYKQLFDSLSKAPADTDEATPQQFQVMAKGNIGMMIGLPWELNSAVGETPSLKSKLGAFPIPSHTAGKTAPVFLGGSNLAVSAGSKQQDLAYEWLKLLAGEKYQTRLAKENGVLPNSTTLAATALGDDPVLGAMAKGAEDGRITPNDPTWAAVEATPNPIKDMLTKILSGKASAADAAAEANNLITQKMAGS